MNRGDVVGLVGLGLIGASIGERLLATGDPPVVLDVVSARVDALVTLGAVAARSPRDLAERCDVVLICVQTDEQCVALLDGPDGLVRRAREGAVICVLSTVSTRTIEALAVAAAAAGVALLEAPMAGQGAKSVADARMFVLTGGAADVRARARLTLERFARVVDAGPLGSGVALKLAHNVMVYVSRIGAYEAVELARAAGVRDGLVAEPSTAWCWRRRRSPPVSATSSTASSARGPEARGRADRQGVSRSAARRSILASSARARRGRP